MAIAQLVTEMMATLTGLKISRARRHVVAHAGKERG
jgi:hypothetical protein